MRISYLLSLLLFLVYSCSGDKHNFTVEVHVDGSGSDLLYLAQRTLTGTLMVDSVAADKEGAYVLEGYAKQPDFYVLYFHPRQYINLIIQPGDDFRVLTDASSFDVNYLIEGSKDSRLIQKMVNMQTRTLEKITDISTTYEKSRHLNNFEKLKVKIDSTYDQVVNEHRQFSIDLIEKNPTSLASLMALYQQLGRNTPVFDYKRDFRYYEMVDSNLTAIYPNSEPVIDLNRKITELRDLLKLEIGSVAPEIALPDSSGNVFSLSSLRGKNVLLVFWASWSSRSFDEINAFALLYPRLALNDLAYYQVSLDRTRESWLKSIDGRQTRGIHVSDLKYWDSPVVDIYRIEKLPVTYLLNKEGVIINKNFTASDLPAILERLNE